MAKMGSQATTEFIAVSKRGTKSANVENILAKGFSEVSENPYDEEKNPDGIINMGTSENKVVANILSEKFSKIQLSNMPAKYMGYNNMRGTAEFRQALATFLDKYMKPAKPINADDLFVFNGCGSVLEMLAFTICDAGDGILVPAPYYGAFRTDLVCRMDAITHSIELTSTIKPEFGETSPFELSAGRMEEAFQAVKSKGINIRAIILCNPNNPLGCIYSKAQLTSYLQFANRYKLQVILDEIYFLSIYDDSATMTTGLSLSGVIDPNLLHVVWGFSKDFGISGFRCGLVHTVNKEVQKVLNANSYFQSVPTIVQYVLTEIISDFKWLESVYLPTNRKRLRVAHDYVVKELKKVGVEAFKSVAGLYVWIDLRKYVKPLSKEGELKLMDAFLANGIYITPGVAFQAPEYGWFRIIFSKKDQDMKLGVTRIIKVLQAIRKCPVETGHEDDLDDLVTNLQEKIRGSDWLEQNTGEKWIKEHPELASKFEEEKHKSELKD